MLISFPEIQSKWGFKLMSVCMLSHVQLITILWKSLGSSQQFSWQEYQGGLSFPPPKASSRSWDLNPCLTYLLHRPGRFFNYAT